jgi:hypothetical protein
LELWKLLRKPDRTLPALSEIRKQRYSQQLSLLQGVFEFSDRFDSDCCDEYREFVESLQYLCTERRLSTPYPGGVLWEQWKNKSVPGSRMGGQMILQKRSTGSTCVFHRLSTSKSGRRSNKCGAQNCFDLPQQHAHSSVENYLNSTVLKK